MTELRLRYQTVEFSQTDIHLCTLRDKQQFSDPEGIAEKLGICSTSWPIFGVIWPSSFALAFFLDHYDISSKRILEVGCGIALPSLLLNSKEADITVTDYHPEVGKFLKRNICINNGNPIFFEQTNWDLKNETLGNFDLIIGSDILYEDQHTEKLAQFILSHAKPRSEIILVDPGRGRKTKFANVLADQGFSMSVQTLLANQHFIEPFKGHIMKFERR